MATLHLALPQLFPSWLVPSAVRDFIPSPEINLNPLESIKWWTDALSHGPISRKFLGKTVLAIYGWDYEGEAPDLDKYVMVGAPHTSNWDFIFAIACTYASEVDITWLGKHTLFKPPFEGLFRALGGLPVVRTGNLNYVEQVAELIRNSERIILALSPEGTRKYTEGWRTGFYYIALKAEVPIVVAYLDYKTRRGGYGPVIYPSGDIEADFKLIEEVLRDHVAKYPEKAAPICPLRKVATPEPVGANGNLNGKH